jgi:hypothetical protein
MYTLIKRLLLMLSLVLVSPLVLLCFVESLIWDRNRERLFSQCKEVVAVAPTIFGQYLRLAFYWAVCDRVSTDVSFLLGSMVAHRATRIGRGVVVGAYSIIGLADIGDNVLLGARVSLLSGKYQHGTPTERQNHANTSDRFERIVVGPGAWIGEQAVVMANVGANCTIAAGAVLYKDALEGGTYMGNPARKVSL